MENSNWAISSINIDKCQRDAYLKLHSGSVRIPCSNIGIFWQNSAIFYVLNGFSQTYYGDLKLRIEIMPKVVYILT